MTYFDLDVLSALKGRVPGQMQIKLPGGWADDVTYVHVAGTPTAGVGDRVLVSLTRAPGEPIDVGMMTTFGEFFLREDSFGGGAFAVAPGGQVILDYSVAYPSTVALLDQSVQGLLMESDPWAGVPERVPLTLDEVMGQWASLLDDARSRQDYRDGEAFTVSTGAR